MKRDRARLAAALVLCALPAIAQAQTVTRVRAQQLPDKTVEVLYDLGGVEGAGATVSVVFSSDGGAHYSITPSASALAWHVGPGVAGGTDRRLIWNAAATLPPSTFETTFRAAVTATNVGPTPTPTPGPGTCSASTVVTLPGNVPLELACIKAGSFQMGAPEEESPNTNEQPVHPVTITKDFYLSKTELTQRQWQAVMGSIPDLKCHPLSPAIAGDNYPVYCVSWTDVAGPGGFVQKLNQLLGGPAFRLPTEAEWEYAARAGTDTRYFFGNAEACFTNAPCPAADPYMWWNGNSQGTVHQVALKLPNPWGLFDVSGGIAEWVNDLYHPEYYGESPVNDPPGPTVGLGYRTIRGGAWTYPIESCRSAFRISIGGESNRYADTGFRLARSTQ